MHIHGFLHEHVHLHVHEKLMKRFALALFLLSPVAATARDLAPSIGVTYARTDLSSGYDTSSIMQGWHQQSDTLDLRYPVCQWLDLNVAGGETRATLNTLTPTFALQSVTAYPGGGIIGQYGLAGASSRQQSMNGYNFSTSARFYFK